MAQLVKCLPAMWETRGLIPGLGRSPGEGIGNSLQYSCLENPMDRGAWQAADHRGRRVGHDKATSLTHSCGAFAPRSGVKPVSPALAVGFLTTGPPGKSRCSVFAALHSVLLKCSAFLGLYFLYACAEISSRIFSLSSSSISFFSEAIRTVTTLFGFYWW